MQVINFPYHGYTITTDKTLMDVSAIHKWLSEKSYWSRYIPYETVKTAFDNSYCIAVLHGNEQVGYARLVTDYAVFAYLADVYIMEAHRGKGLSKVMLHALLDQDWVKALRGLKLGTTDGHGLYRKFGFTHCKYPDRIMEISRPGIYGDEQSILQ